MLLVDNDVDGEHGRKLVGQRAVHQFLGPSRN
jgi:hypothetical protein